ncbi:hypothetical protein Aperf_G00000064790 [Anoplocephala perfoliata]
MDANMKSGQYVYKSRHPSWVALGADVKLRNGQIVGTQGPTKNFLFLDVWLALDPDVPADSQMAHSYENCGIGQLDGYAGFYNGDFSTGGRRSRAVWSTEGVLRDPWTPLLEDYRQNNGVVDREPLVYYPEDIRFQRDIPQASSSSRRQFPLRWQRNSPANNNLGGSYQILRPLPPNPSALHSRMLSDPDVFYQDGPCDTFCCWQERRKPIVDDYRWYAGPAYDDEYDPEWHQPRSFDREERRPHQLPSNHLQLPSRDYGCCWDKHGGTGDHFYDNLNYINGNRFFTDDQSTDEWLLDSSCTLQGPAGPFCPVQQQRHQPYPTISAEYRSSDSDAARLHPDRPFTMHNQGIFSDDTRKDYRLRSDRWQPRAGGSIQEIPMTRRSRRSSGGYSSPHPPAPPSSTNLWTGGGSPCRRRRSPRPERSHPQSSGRALPGSAFSPYESRRAFDFDQSRRFSPIGASLHLDASSPSADKPSLALRNGHLSSENFRASAEAAVADQLPPGAHPVDLRSATTTPPPSDTSTNLLQRLLDSPATSPTPPPPPLHGGGPRPSPSPSPTATPEVSKSHQQHLQVPIDGTRMIPLSPTVILRQVETEKRPPDPEKDVTKKEGKEEEEETKLVKEDLKLKVEEETNPQVAVNSHQKTLVIESQAPGTECPPPPPSTKSLTGTLSAQLKSTTNALSSGLKSLFKDSTQPASDSANEASSRAAQLRRSFSTKSAVGFNEEIDLAFPNSHDTNVSSVYGTRTQTSEHCAGHGERQSSSRVIPSHTATTQAEEANSKVLRSSRSQDQETTTIERDYDAPLREYSKFSASVSQLFDSTSLNNIVAAVENETPLSQEEQLRQLRIRAGLAETNLQDYHTQSYQHQQDKANRDRVTFTGSLPALNTQTPPKAGNVFGSFMSRAQNAASGLMKQVNVVAEAAKQVVSEAQAMIVVDEKPQQPPQQTQQQPQLRRQFSTKAPSDQRNLSHPDENLPELTPPAPDDAKESDGQDLIAPAEFIDESEERTTSRAWGQSSSMEQDYDQAGSFGYEENDADRERWIEPQEDVRRNGDHPRAGSERAEDEAWLRSRKKDEKARDGMLMATATGIHDQMVNGQSYYEEEENFSDHQEDNLRHRNDKRRSRWDEDGEDDIRTLVQKRYQQLQELSEEEDEYQSDYSDEEIDDEEEDEGDYDVVEDSRRQHRHRSHKKGSFETNEDQEGEYVDEDESGSNEEIGSDEYFHNKRHHRKSRRHHNSNSLTSNEAMRMMPPPEDERPDKLKDVVSVEADQKRQNYSGDANRGSSIPETQLESEPTSTIDKGSKQPIARKRWFDAFDHVCRKLNESGVLPRKKAGDNHFSFYNINSMPDFKLKRKPFSLVSDLTMAVQKRNMGTASANLITRQSINNEELKQHVYKKTLQALLYPISSDTPHKFQVWSATSPTYCYECEGMLWGLARQGLRCTECGVKCHEKCRELLNADCLQRAAEKSVKHGAEDRTQSIKQAMSSMMRQRICTKPELFDLVGKVFKVEDAHKQNLQQAQKSILDGTCQWSAKIAITVKCAQGLIGKDKTGTSDPYVTVQVGKVKKRTKTVPQELNPVWNEKFYLDEDNDLRSKLRSKLTSESDDFLGQTVIDVRTLSGEMDVWYNLEKRTDKSAVSGAIRLHISVEIKGEEKVAPYHVQYTCLHENIFYYLCETNKNNGEPEVKIPEAKGDDSWKVYFDSPAQEIITEFAIRYGIETMYQAMTHFSCLTTKFMCTGVPATMSSLLANINAFYAHTSASSNQTASERFSASNFGVQELTSPPRASQVVKECAQACMQTTYQFLYENCNDLYSRQFQDKISTDEAGPSLKSLDFWHRLIALLVSVIEEDKTTYAAVINQFPQEANMGLISAHCMWTRLSEDLAPALEQHANNPNRYCKTSDYMNLCFKVKWFYNSHISEVPELKNVVPAYPSWFEPFVMQWLNENDEISMDFLRNAYQRDKKDGFHRSSGQALFSNSVVDVFTQLNQCFDIMKKLECPDPVVNDRFLNRFSQTVGKVLLTYAEVVKADFVHWVENQETACILMNNIQQCRVQLEKVYEAMGGDQNLKEDTKVVMHDLQQMLNDSIDEMAEKYSAALCSPVLNKVNEVNKLLHQILPNSKANIESEADLILRPLMDYFESSLSVYADICEKTVLKRILKELWKITMYTFEKQVVLPPVSDPSALFLNLSIPSTATAKLTSVSQTLLSNVSSQLPSNKLFQEMSKESSGATLKNLNQRHCQVMGIALDAIKSYFHAGGSGLKNNYLEKSPEFLSLQHALSLYTQSTDTLIKNFVNTQKSQDKPAVEDSVGELSIQVDLFRHPSHGEHKVTVSIISANNLKWVTNGTFRPFVEVYIIGPLLADKRRKFATKSKTGVWSPTFNETCTFILGAGSEPESYELHMCAKDYCFGRADRLIGLTVLQLRDLTASTDTLGLGTSGACACWCALGRRLQLDETGWTILRILSQRPSDEVAREFVRLKSEARGNDDSPGTTTSAPSTLRRTK